MPRSLDQRADQILASTMERAGNAVSGLDLTEIGLDGHAVANTLWHIAAYLAKRRPDVP